MKKKEKKHKSLKENYFCGFLKTRFRTFVWLLIFITQLTPLCAQSAKITISLSNTGIEDVLKEIQKQSGLNYLLNNEEVSKDIKVSVNVKNETIEEALNQCFKNLNLTYKIVDNVIIVTPKKQQEPVKENPKTKAEQSIKGNISDKESGEPLVGATVVIKGTNPLKGNAADAYGNFRIDNIPVGRYNIEINYVGYEPYLVREILIGSGKEVVLNIGLKESVTHLDEVKIIANSNKEAPINSMATLSAQQLSVEEANRFAGGMDDPARLVSSYAGVASNVGNNGIVIRGNSPKGLLWNMEGVQIPNPNHFGDYVGLGGGAVTALSSQTMSNSDFYTGAFPAEYGNTLSGVFDMKMRTGNQEKREYVFQAGLIGIDVAAEGPFVKGKKSTYLFNYRYSTLGLLAPILPKEMGILKYQDLSFKLNFPTKKLGIFSVWGIGALDYQSRKPLDNPNDWEYETDGDESKANISMGAVGLNHKIKITNKIYLNTTFAQTGNSLDWLERRYYYRDINGFDIQDKQKVDDKRWKYTLTSYLNFKFSSKHSNKTGIILDRLNYNIDVKYADNPNVIWKTYVYGKGASNLFQFYSQSKITPKDNFTINLGIHSQYFMFNKKYTIEPRFGVRWNFLPAQTLSFAYGMHSQLESIHLYLAQKTDSGYVNLDGQYQPELFTQPNKNLDFDKAHHFVLGYELRLSDNVMLKIEPYLQLLYNIPVVRNSYISTINIKDVWTINDSLVNKGTGHNAGIDLTLERFLNKGFYYLVTASFFDSKYKGGDGIERNTRYNKNYVINLLVGKEWFIGKTKNNIFGTNIRLNYLGGDRITPVNVEETLASRIIVEDVSRAFSRKSADDPILSLAINYRINKPRHSSIWTLQIINALAHKVFQEYKINLKTNNIDATKDLLYVPNLSYKIEF
jgi:hypothetical protein